MVQQTTYYKLGTADGNHSSGMASMWVKCRGSQADLCILSCFVYTSVSARARLATTSSPVPVLTAATLPSCSLNCASAPHLQKCLPTSQVQSEERRIKRLQGMQTSQG